MTIHMTSQASIFKEMFGLGAFKLHIAVSLQDRLANREEDSTTRKEVLTALTMIGGLSVSEALESGMPLNNGRRD